MFEFECKDNSFSVSHFEGQNFRWRERLKVRRQKRYIVSSEQNLEWDFQFLCTTPPPSENFDCASFCFKCSLSGANKAFTVVQNLQIARDDDHHIVIYMINIKSQHIIISSYHIVKTMIIDYCITISPLYLLSIILPSTSRHVSDQFIFSNNSVTPWPWQSLWHHLVAVWRPRCDHIGITWQSLDNSAIAWFCFGTLVQTTGDHFGTM